MKLLRDDANFRARLSKQVSRLGQLEKLGSGLGSEQERQDILLGVLRMCNFNAGLLTPYYYPKFSDEGKPLSMMDRPHALALFDLNIGGETTVRSGRQIGKCLGGNTLCKISCSELNEDQMVTVKSLFDICKSHAVA